MIVVAGGMRFRGADVNVAFRELWWAAKGSAGYSDERGDFIANAMRAMAVDVCMAVAPEAEPEVVEHSVEALMRRVGVERLNTPAHLLALGGLLGRYVISDESPRDTQTLDHARAQLRAAWWSSGLDRAAVAGTDGS
jgi:hypothetical protein